MKHAKTLHEPDPIMADADYFQTLARRCYRLARRATEAARALESLGDVFERKARRVADRAGAQQSFPHTSAQ
jgi:succinate dehydrogenase/fumarate reductase flavoprotein subunit